MLSVIALVLEAPVSVLDAYVDAGFELARARHFAGQDPAVRSKLAAAARGQRERKAFVRQARGRPLTVFEFTTVHSGGESRALAVRRHLRACNVPALCLDDPATAAYVSDLWFAT